MNTETSPILTPDQRLRVFVSSTLQELAEERSAVKNAIQHMHLTPVMFELGARPHAPRNLYREYLSQSHIFVGIYWGSYGWVAPDENISGLEDEYNLSGDLPKLIYIKESEEKREDRLARLLKRIEQDDKVSYKKFTSSDELANLIINDLALLLTERFNLTLHQKITETENKTFHSIPSFPNRLIGREEAIEEITTIMSDPANRLITLTGAGGIGKTRLAIEAARLLQVTYPNGAVFVPLAPVRDPELVDETICYALGIKVSGGNMLDSLKLFLQDKKFLLVLDNFEQIIEAASIIDDLLIASPGLKIIVTSRERLALSFEQVYTVPALANVCPEQLKDDEKHPAAFELFVQRAKAIQPSFEVTPQNREIICKICRRVEGLPLAIELAAGQVNLFSPSILLQKLEKSLCVLKGNFRDTPDRQKTIHNTVEWSFELLCAAEQNLLLQVSLYPAGCLLTAVESMEIEAGHDVYALLGSLVDKSLLIKQEEASEVRFQMLESVREFSKEKLKDPELLEHLMQQQAEYYHRALQGIKLPKDDINQTQLLKYLETEQPNIRQVLDFLMQKKDIRKVADIAWNLWLFWWVNAHTKEGYTWLKKAWEFNNENPSQLDEYTFAILTCNVGIMSFLQRDLATYNESVVKNMDLLLGQQDDELVGTSALIAGVVKTIVRDYCEAERLLDISLDRFQKIGLTTGTSIALSALGRNAIYDGNRAGEAKEYYKESMAHAKADDNEISVIIALSGFALCEVMEKNADAKNYLREGILLSQSLHFYEALAWCMEIWSLVSINERRFLHAVTLMSAVDRMRTIAQIPVWDDLRTVMLDAKRHMKQKMKPEEFLKAWNEGAAMSLDRMIAYAMEG